ncbi:hypothetical protein [Nonomuraea jabiensis]|uniref:hypothetical protein n=1 Tax=Nonomuraea jabiensis TaxID=882448 RepID=UPI003D745B92
MRSRRYSSGDGEGRVFAIGVVAMLSLAVVVTIASADEDDVEEVVADCVIATQQADGTYQVVDDRYCEGGSHVAYYHWLYGSSTASRTGYVRGGTTTRPANAQITSRTGKVISRGGFGGRGTGGGG